MAQRLPGHPLTFAAADSPGAGQGRGAGGGVRPGRPFKGLAKHLCPLCHSQTLPPSCRPGKECTQVEKEARRGGSLTPTYFMRPGSVSGGKSPWIRPPTPTPAPRTVATRGRQLSSGLCGCPPRSHLPLVPLVREVPQPPRTLPRRSQRGSPFLLPAQTHPASSLGARMRDRHRQRARERGVCVRAHVCAHPRTHAHARPYMCPEKAFARQKQTGSPRISLCVMSSNDPSK